MFQRLWIAMVPYFDRDPLPLAKYITAKLAHRMLHNSGEHTPLLLPLNGVPRTNVAVEKEFLDRTNEGLELWQPSVREAASPEDFAEEINTRRALFVAFSGKSTDLLYHKKEVPKLKRLEEFATNRRTDDQPGIVLITSDAHHDDFCKKLLSTS
ncbi:MAG: hypothetical protein QF809_00165 [Candidatus Peribacteraceae bacterium]|nr:hypothetical protein [Candidatus Peribacteraceae bacterium]MDP7645592.1 hypothetical protein [Candidatus Peribacteraceae bacterium]